MIRDPLPEVLRGDPKRTEALIDTCPHDWSYRAGVIAFTAEDAPSEAEQQEVMDRFEELAFAGLDPDRYDMLWVRHSHERRVELHFCTPQMELESGKSLNIAPPGYERAFDSLRDLMNKTHGWADPMDVTHAQEVRRVPERPEALTALERELLGYVERLASSCEASAQELRGLEARSTGQIESKLDGLADCVGLLLRSQSALAEALRALLSGSASYTVLERQLAESLAQAKSAERRLNGN